MKPVNLALVSSLSLALVDQLRAVVSGHSHLENLHALFVPIGVLTLLLLVGYGAAWIGVGLLDRISHGRGGEPVAITAAVLVAAPILWYLIGEFAYSEDPQGGYFVINSWKRWPVTLFVGVFTAISGWATYLTAARFGRERSSLRVVLANLLEATPALLLLGLLLAWHRGHPDSPDHGSSFVIVLVALSGTHLIVLGIQRAREWRVWGHVALLSAVGAGALLGLAADADPEAPGPVRAAGDRAPPRILLITVDTLRADRLGVYGGPSDVSPNLDAFARDALVFDQARSTSSWTVPSFASIMTGVTPWVHEADKTDPRLPENLATLAERLRAAGYGTAAIGEQGWLSKQRGGHGRKPFLSGFDRDSLYTRSFPPGIGYRVLKKLAPERYRTELQTSEITAWAVRHVADHADEAFFLWTHFYDPHDPLGAPSKYLPDEPGVRAFVDRRDDSQWEPSAEEIALLEVHYDAEIRYVDEGIGRILEALHSRGLYDDSLIIVTSDHGEEFYDHGQIGHGHNLHDELIRIPLVIKLPGSTQTGRVPATVSNAGIVGTILDLSGLPGHDDLLIARSLRPTWSGEDADAAGRITFSRGILNGEPREAVVFDGVKYVRFDQSRRVKLYDLRRDPGEASNLGSVREAQRAQGDRLLDGHALQALAQRRALGVEEATDSPGLDRESVEKLRALGYLQ